MLGLLERSESFALPDAANAVPSHGYYLIAANGYAGSPTRDESLAANNLSGTAGHALLVAKTTNVTGCADPAIVDRVGYGASATCPEGGSGQHTASPGSGSSVSRKPGGSFGHGQDTDINSDDFLAAQASAFHNRASVPASPPVLLGNVKNTLFLTKGPTGSQLDWARAAGATGYRIYRGTTSGFLSGSPAPWQTTADPMWIDPTVPVPILFYVVKATDGTGESPE